MSTTTTRPVILQAWEGLGDTIYLRPSVRVLAERHDLHVATPWPELLEDLDVRFVQPEPKYRTQAVNVQGQDPARWGTRPVGVHRLVPRVRWRSGLSIPEAIAGSLGLDAAALTFDLPAGLPAPSIPAPYAVVRPVTVRREWRNPARNPDPRYVAAASAHLQDRGFTVLSVAHLKASEEWALEPLPPADHAYHHGQLDVRSLMGLVRGAELVVGGPGWIVPASAAAGTPCLVIAGGQGYYNRPDRLVGRPMDASLFRWILPDDYCRDCHPPDHACPKAITDFPGHLHHALEELLG